MLPICDQVIFVNKLVPWINCYIWKIWGTSDLSFGSEVLTVIFPKSFR